MISQMILGSEILKVLARYGVKEISVRHMNAVFGAATEIIKELQREFKPATPNMGLQAWLNSDDTGMSSLFMATVCAPPHSIPEQGEHLNDQRYPLDPSDFGRYYRFLEAVPEYRCKLPLIAEAGGPKWKALIDHWGELEALYIEEMKAKSAPKLYARMKELIDGAK